MSRKHLTVGGLCIVAAPAPAAFAEPCAAPQVATASEKAERAAVKQSPSVFADLKRAKLRRQAQVLTYRAKRDHELDAAAED